MTPFLWRAPSPLCASGEDRVRLRRRPKPSDPRSWNLMLASAGTGVPVRMAVDSPALLAAAVEDLEWCLAMKELRARRPRRWQHSAMVEWAAEMDRLEQKRKRIAENAAEAVSVL